MRTAIATAFTAAMILGSSLAFAADNNNGDKAKEDQTGSITRQSTELPDQKTIEYCKTAPVDDATCRGVPKQ